MDTRRRVASVAAAAVVAAGVVGYQAVQPDGPPSALRPIASAAHLDSGQSSAFQGRQFAAGFATLPRSRTLSFEVIRYTSKTGSITTKLNLWYYGAGATPETITTVKKSSDTIDNSDCTFSLDFADVSLHTTVTDPFTNQPTLLDAKWHKTSEFDFDANQAALADRRAPATVTGTYGSAPITGNSTTQLSLQVLPVPPTPEPGN